MKWKVEQFRYQSVNHGLLYIAYPVKTTTFQAGGTFYKYTYPADGPFKFDTWREAYDYAYTESRKEK